MKKLSLLAKIKELSWLGKIALGSVMLLIIGFVAFMAIPIQESQVKAEDNYKISTGEIKEDPVRGEESVEEEEASKVIYNENGIKIDFKGVVKTDTNGAKIKIFIENNNSISKKIQVRDLSINGYMISGICSADVEPSKKSNSYIEILGTYLKENKIEKIDSIEFKFAIINKDDVSNQYVTDTISINL